MMTTGDAVQNRALSEIGGKGLFTKELEEALHDGRLDIAVHSMKDVPTVLPEGLCVRTVLPREDVRDGFVSRRHASLDALPQGALFGTSSLRRKAQLLAARPDLRVVEFRGNVQTRLGKLDSGVAEATLLAMAGLNRLGQAGIAVPVDETRLLPAVAQGAIGIEQRSDDARISALLAPLHDHRSWIEITAERAFLAQLDGSCRTPIAGLARFDGSTLQFAGEVLRPDGTARLATARSGTEGDAAALGRDAAEELLRRGAADLLG